MQLIRLLELSRDECTAPRLIQYLPNPMGALSFELMHPEPGLPSLVPEPAWISMVELSRDMQRLEVCDAATTLPDDLRQAASMTIWRKVCPGGDGEFVFVSTT